jgi:hypothetical protein
MDAVKLETILDLHAKWLDDEESGKRAYLRGEDLSNMDLSGINLSHADLTEVDFSHSNLSNANLSQAAMMDAELSMANLSNADLSYADLTKATLDNTDLTDANLTGTNFSGVDLDTPTLREAYLDEIKTDLFEVLDHAPQEVRGLLQALEGGHVDGETYSGECCCLVGTIANIQGCNYLHLPDITPDADRPIELWFFGIVQGDTPESSIVAAITAEWINDWLAHGSMQREVTHCETEANL